MRLQIQQAFLITMKSPLIAMTVLAVLPVAAAEPQPFAPAPLRLELPRPPTVIHLRSDGALPASCDTTRIGYDAPRARDPRLDAPGPGYRAQKARANRVREVNDHASPRPTTRPVS